MRALAGELLLTASDRGVGEDDLNRGLTLLSLALPGSDRRQLAKLTLAQRNVLLLRLRELSFGPVLKGFGACSQCSAHLEFALPVAALIERLDSHLREDAVAWSDQEGSYQLRSVTTEDLLIALDQAGDGDAQRCLLERCLTVRGNALSAPQAEAIPGVIEKFDALHAGAELTCVIECPDCHFNQSQDFDIARFLWLEVRAAARRLLAEIHELAWAYGWSERTIARMSCVRRSAYLEMLSA
jgi:hypothetical protein